ncbi:MAG: hypothetical protein EOP06_00850 [Proteobacteria bacterium]|nr:MAG: hypothetical protein EOP06_00850 [Pseudomonadota bacterium]
MTQNWKISAHGSSHGELLPLLIDAYSKALRSREVDAGETPVQEYGWVMSSLNLPREEVDKLIWENLLNDSSYYSDAKIRVVYDLNTLNIRQGRSFLDEDLISISDERIEEMALEDAISLYRKYRSMIEDLY